MPKFLTLGVTTLPKRSKYGYRIEGRPRQKMSHLFYMDDLKIIATNK